MKRLSSHGHAATGEISRGATFDQIAKPPGGINRRSATPEISRAHSVG